ncbi:hypothetical protein ACKWTF_001003 [Chironomus riparius]
MARKKEVTKDSESDSDVEDVKKIKDVKKAKQDSSDEEDDDVESEEEEMIYNEYTNPTDHLKIETKFPLELKLQLLAEIKNINKRKTSSYKVAMKHFDWTQISIEGHTIEECKACLDEILKPICSIRTLDEMLTDYEQHHQKYDLKMHPDAPKIPRNAVMRFIDDNRDKFKKALIKEFPGTQIGLKEISSYGAKKFNELPATKQEQYKAQYKVELKAYAEKKAELLRNCPELVKKRAVRIRTTKDKKVRERKGKPELPYVTPFMIYREELAKEGKTITYHDAQQLYKNMPDEEKIKHIQTLLALDTHLDKQFSSQEQKILKNPNGMPARPLNAYNFFLKDLCKDTSIDRKEILKTSSILWKTIDPEKKAVYIAKYQNEVEAWQEKMKLWIQTLPVEQQSEQMAKHGFLSKLESTKKRKRNDDSLMSLQNPPLIESDPKKRKKQTTLDNIVTIKKEEPKEKSVINIIPASPTKQSKVSNAQIANVSSLSKTVDIDTPTKKKKKGFESDASSIDSTPRKKKFKETVESFGSYPSLNAAHYFMTQKYTGKPSKVAKAYSKLSKHEKKQINAEMKKIKNDYFLKLKKFATENTNYADKVRNFHTSNRQEQEQSISWHTAKGTDNSDDSDDDSDQSDSS